MHHTRGSSTRLSANFSTETMEARKHWNDIFKGVKENFKPKLCIWLYYPSKKEGQIYPFPDKQKLRDFVNISIAL